jgi:hypothetical protein
MSITFAVTFDEEELLSAAAASVDELSEEALLSEDELPHPANNAAAIAHDRQNATIFFIILILLPINNVKRLK